MNNVAIRRAAMKPFLRLPVICAFFLVIVGFLPLVLDSSAAHALRPLRGARRGLAQRGGSCQPGQAQPLTALMPLYKTERGAVLALSTTQAAYPTFWFYLPYAITPERPAELRLEFSDPENPIYRQQRTVVRLVRATAGIVGIQFPRTEMPLEPNQQYDFQLVVQCDAQDASTNQFVNFSILRKAPTADVQRLMGKGTDRDRFRLYQASGLWNEALSTLFTLRRQNPQDAQLATDWAKLLETFDLAAIARQPLGDCCQTESP